MRKSILTLWDRIKINMNNEQIKKTLWGKGIFILYSGFVLFMLAIVIFSTMQDFQLVEKNYYQNELKYQSRIEQTQNHLSLETKPIWVLNQDEKVLTLKFPSEFMSDGISGTVLFFRPSDKSHDIKVELLPDPSGLQIIPIDKLIKGKWKLKVNWESKNTKYYFEDIFVIGE